MTDSIQITLTREQATVVRDAVDLYNRLKLGQLTELWRFFEHELHKRYKNDTDGYCAARDRAEQLLLELKAELRFPANHGAHGSYGVGSPELTKDDNRAYEIYKVLDHALWKLWHVPGNKDTMWCVSSDNPYLLNFSKDEPIPCVVQRDAETADFLKIYFPSKRNTP
jgi:hypothetical protein